MKKIIVLLISVFLLSGCGTKTELEGEITEIKYNDIIILKDDYGEIKKLLNTDFKSNKIDNLDNKLTIKTKKDIYYYTVNDEYLGLDGKYAANDKLGKHLKNLQKKYNNTDFYTIEYTNNHEINEDDHNVLLDKTSNYIIIKLDEKVKNFKINAIEPQNNEYKDIDLLYHKNDLDKKTIVIRRSINFGAPDIKISFENPYNYLVSIIPTYNEEEEKVEFNTSYKTKENS